MSSSEPDPPRSKIVLRPGGQVLHHGVQHQAGIRALLVDPPNPEPRASAIEFLLRDPKVTGVVEEAVPRASLVKDALSRGKDGRTRRGLDDLASDPFRDAGADIDHGFREGREIEFCRAVQQGHLVVVLEYSVAKPLEDTADPLHAEDVQLGGSKRTDARCPIHGNSPIEGEKDLLVPDRGRGVEVAVDDSKDIWSFHRGAT